MIHRPPFSACSGKNVTGDTDDPIVIGKVDTCDVPHQYIYPRDPATAPMEHAASRLTFAIRYKRTYAIGILELAAPAFIGLTSMLQYFLPVHDYRARLQACTTALLAAVVQHSSLRGQLPPQSVVTSADVLMIISYVFIFFGSAFLHFLFLSCPFLCPSHHSES